MSVCYDTEYNIYNRIVLQVEQIDGLCKIKIRQLTSARSVGTAKMNSAG